MNAAAADAALQQCAVPIALRTCGTSPGAWAPFLFILYVLNSMDRVNISYAPLQMTGDLGFSNAVFGFGALGSA